MALYLWHLHKPLKSLLKISWHSERHRPGPGMAEGENKKKVFQLCQPGGSGLSTTNGVQSLRTRIGEPQEEGCKERGGARPCGTILESSIWAAGDTAVAPRPLTGDGVLTCCLSAEGVSSSARGRSPQGCSACVCPAKAKSPRALTLLLVTAALHPQPSPSSFNKRLYLPLPLPSGLQQLISVPLTAAHCVIIRYVNPMCQPAT